ncbi:MULTISPECIES: PEGA domain-containing protein [unclassified Fibrobacter]|uniref:PEGA domain-containing protein n=1 Tax=unclassified Fibrobacter TaxID=2634177 RepID=UPI000D6B2276|nr:MULTISPECIES: PEGA domain-containing protein [unclassified Fibrobacter]PWJ60747.1 PEGA domain-containing protein [Fibrobacter sp. UWR4]PZW64363.1 PEGA domain-containing protein [Fibrobacter sp. UWR1]
MNKFFFAILLLVTAFLHAQEAPGIRANVELVNGAKQNAMFLGVHQDTVHLGGIIQGKFTVVKILKNRFKSIMDEQGNDLLNAPATESPKDSSSHNDSTAQPSVQEETVAQTPPQENSNASYQFLSSVEGKHIFVALERRSIDSILADQLNALTIRLLQEKGVPVVMAKRSDFGYCREQACIRDSLLHYGAASVFQGSIAAARAQDSLNIDISRTIFNRGIQKTDSAAVPADTVHTAKMTLSTFTAMNDAIEKNKLSEFLTQLMGIQIEKKTDKKKSYIRVESNPEGATLEIEGRDAICKTPCTFATLDTGKIILYAHWSVDAHIWAARSNVTIIPGDTAKISMKLTKAKPELLITSVPEGAEIYAGSEPLTKTTKAVGKTPSKYPLYEPGISTIQLRKEGFRDTTVSVYTAPMELTSVEVQMTPINDPAELINQQEWIREKKKIFIGQTLMGSAIAPVLIGTLFTYLAYLDYNDAGDIKDDLNRSATTNGANYQKMVKKNHDLVHDGDRKMVIGGSLLGVGAALFAIGFALSF